MDSIISRVINITAGVLGKDDEKICSESVLQGDLGADSMDTLELIFQMEEEFGIHLEDDDFFPGKDIKEITVQDIANLIRDNMNLAS